MMFMKRLLFQSGVIPTLVEFQSCQDKAIIAVNIAQSTKLPIITSNDGEISEMNGKRFIKFDHLLFTVTGGG